MKIAEIRQKTEKELNKLLGEKREKLRELRFDLAAGKVKDIKDIRGTRKDIAKILTILNEKEAGVKNEVKQK